MPFRITLERNTLRFAAAHFTTFGDECEPLHGHNYDVFVEISGELTEDSWLMDFGEAKRLVRALCGELDHRFILPLRNPAVGVEARDHEYEIRCAGRRYVIPRSDVAALEIDNSTAERLAEWFASRLADELRKLGVRNVTSINLSVEEMPGQAGWHSRPL
jgi:6-pyruvoyltetrahydropterin/6-carboxytetrahydropterin synthase